MSANEKELLNIIREHENPKKALEIAFDLLITFLEKHEVPQDTSVESPRATA